MTSRRQAQQRAANRQRQAEFVKRLAEAHMKIVRVKAHVEDETRIKAYAARLLQAWSRGDAE